MFQRYQFVGVIILSVTMTVFWAIGRYDLASIIYIVGCAVLLLGTLKAFATLHGYGKVDVDEMPGFLGWHSIPDRKMQLGIVFVIIGEIGAWPVRGVIGSMLGGAIGAYMPHPMMSMRDDEAASVLFFYLPRTTIIFLAFTIQSILFCYIFPSEYYGTTVSIIALSVHATTYTIFVLHLLFKDGSLRNFQDAAVHPYISFVITFILAVLSSAIVHLTVSAISSGSVPRLNEAEFFLALKALTIDQRVLDLGAIAKESHDFRSLLFRTYEFLTATSALQVMDLVLGAMVVVNLTRSVFAIVLKPRDDQSLAVRSIMLASIGRHAQAAQAAKRIKDKAMRGDVRTLVYIAEGNTEAFEAMSKNSIEQSIRHLWRIAPISALRRDFGCRLHYLHSHRKLHENT